MEEYQGITEDERKQLFAFAARLDADALFSPIADHNSGGFNDFYHWYETDVSPYLNALREEGEISNMFPRMIYDILAAHCWYYLRSKHHPKYNTMFGHGNVLAAVVGGNYDYIYSMMDEGIISIGDVENYFNLISVTTARGYVSHYRRLNNGQPTGYFAWLKPIFATPKNPDFLQKGFNIWDFLEKIMTDDISQSGIDGHVSDADDEEEELTVEQLSSKVNSLEQDLLSVKTYLGLE